jgi:hypothetical protein
MIAFIHRRFRYLLFLLFLMPATLVLAQNTPADTIKKSSGKFFLDVFGGYSMPFGKYADNNRNEDAAGYAAGGFTVQLSGSWLGKRGFGLGLSYVYQNSSLQSEFANDTLVDMYEPLGTDHWSNHFLMGGPVFIHDFGRILLTIKVQLGANLSYSPLFKIWMPSTDTLNPTDMTLTKGPGFGVAFQSLAGIGYQITERFSISATVSFLGSNPSRTKSYSFERVETDPVTGQKETVYVQGERSRKKKISTFNLGVGLCFKL